ncbi:MAG: filamentous hemagglutinin N-terminal domain-containing protein, partial [Variovorax sp.]
MNRIYRVVWNTSLNLWVAVAETARGKGKSAASVVLNVAAASLLVPACLASAQAVPSATVSGGAARAFVAPNGVTVVNIEAANAAGLSHNRYTQFNVNPAGLVLNNGNAAQANWQSQLAGQLAANPNLGASARVILNEVVSNNRSTLAGFTEVMGGRADVILANPYGITCSGCGFINTDRVTLTTGLPTFGPDGSLRGFSVQQGDILVNGNGLNATAQQVLDLVARSVRIDGSISANDLGITTGTNAWDYGSRAVTGSAGALGSAPTYAVDSSALGGMYANRIRMTATEAGVGVRMLGDAAATADDFTLSAAGRIELSNRISAQRDLAINSATAIAVAGSSLTAARDLNLASEAGAATLADSALVAGQNLGVSGGSVALNAGTLLQAGNALSARATAGDLALGSAAVTAGGAMQLSSTGTTRIEAGANQGVQSRAGDIAINALGGLNNAGAVSAD